MATLDDSPSLFSGQQWTDWADALAIDTEPDKDESDSADDTSDIESMKLKLEDMPLFGHCPSRDEFYLVVCDKCNQVLKPQAFQTHLDLRHGGKGGYTTHSSSKSHHQASSRHSISSKSHPKSHHSPSKSHSRSHSKSHHSPNKAHRHAIRPASPLKPINTELIVSGTESSTNISVTDVKPNIATKASVKVPPQSLDAAAKVGADGNTDKVNDSSKSMYHNNNPVVKMERMPETLAMKKHRDSIGSSHPLTNGSLRTYKSAPPLDMPVITDIDDIKDIVISEKPANSPIPHLTSAAESDDLYMGEVDMAPTFEAEINDAVSSILEPLSPVPEPEPGGLVALATSSATITTNTVTMATLTTSITSVTNVISTTTSFKFSDMGRPTLPMGSIRVNFSSGGVVNKVTTDGVIGNINNNNNNAVPKTIPVSEQSRPATTLVSDSNMESTISDIVKSAVNSGNTGGFKSLSPLLSSPPRSASNPVNKCNSSFKSPSNVGHLVKSNSGSNLTKVGSKLSPSASIVFKSPSTGSIVTSAQSATSSSSPVNTDAIKKFQLLNKPDKIIPLKDREYDPNKHCGVMVTETGKPCTRSLTCKSHALSLRRAVNGRRLPFDELLQEHRDAKEAYLKAKLESKEATMALKAAQAATKSTQPHTIVSSLGKVTTLPSSGTATVAKSIAQVTQATPVKDVKPTLSMPVFALRKPDTVSRPASISSHRTSLSSLGSPSSQDELQSPTGRAGDKSGLEEDEDSAYTSYHPRPIAACSFGARYHNNYGNGFGCHTFGRKTDRVRAVLLEMLEKHSNPPPPKKLCVEANLPREHEFSDPYEFGFLDSTRNHLGQQVIQGPSIITSVNKVVAKQKPKPMMSASGHTIVAGSKPKFKDAITLSKTPVPAVQSTAMLNNGASPSKKRKGSGAMLGGPVSATLVSAPSNILASVGAISHATGGNQQHQLIAIPSVNISGAALSQISANLVTGGNLKHAKNNVIKDMGFYVTGIPQEALLNGQIVNITNSQITPADINVNQMQNSSQDDGNKTLQQVNVITNSKAISHQQAKLVNSITGIEAIRAIQAGKSSLITNLPQNAVLLESNLPPGTVLQPVTFTTSTVTPVMSVGNVFTTSQQGTQHRPSTTTPMTSNSPLPNGIISNQSDKEVYLSQRHPVFHSKPGSQPLLQQAGVRGTIAHTPNLFSGTQLHSQTLTFHAAPANVNSSNTMPSQLSSNPNSVLPGHQIHVKNSIQKTGTVGKLQPVSITIPFGAGSTTGNSGSGIEIGGHGQQHTLYITSDHAAQNAGLHLQQAEVQAHNSPSHQMIS